MDDKQTRDDKQARTLKRLIKKLSALRHTLSKSERELLDTLVLGEPAEVEGHAMMQGAKLSGAKLAGAKLAGAKLAGEAEVEGHAMLQGAKLSGAKLSGAKLAGAKLAGAKLAGAKLAGQQVVFNAVTGSYEVED